MKKLFLTTIFIIAIALILSSSGKAAGRNIFLLLRQGKARIVQVNLDDKTYKTVFEAGKAPGIPYQFTTDSDNLYALFNDYTKYIITLSSLSNPSEISKKFEINTDELEKKYGCNISRPQSIQIIDGKTIIVLFRTNYGESYKLSTLFYILDTETGKLREYYYKKPVSSECIVKDHKIYYKVIGSDDMITINLRPPSFKVEDAGFGANNLQLSDNKNSWWAFNAEKTSIIKKNPTTGEKKVYNIKFPPGIEDYDAGLYMPADDPLFFINGGAAFQVMYYRISGADREEVDTISRLYFYNFKTDRLKTLGPHSGGHNMGFQKISDGWLAFNRVYNLRSVYIYKFSPDNEFISFKEFPVKSGDEMSGDEEIEVDGRCWLFKPDGSILFYCDDVARFIPLKEDKNK